jgi:hypothetical protein
VFGEFGLDEMLSWLERTIDDQFGQGVVDRLAQRSGASHAAGRRGCQSLAHGTPVLPSTGASDGSACGGAGMIIGGFLSIQVLVCKMACAADLRRCHAGPVARAAVDRFYVHLSKLGNGSRIDVFSVAELLYTETCMGYGRTRRRSDHDDSRE